MIPYLALSPKFHTPVSTAADEDVALERGPLHPVHWTQVSTVCFQILFRVGCAAFVYVAVLCASYIHALISPAEIKGHATASATDEGLTLDIAHGCCSCGTDLLLGYCPFQLDQVCVLKALHELKMSFPAFYVLALSAAMISLSTCTLMHGDQYNYYYITNGYYMHDHLA